MAAEKKILLVDDDKDILEMLTYNLEKEGYIVKSCSDGIKAVEFSRVFLPDLILLDIMMPYQDGVETCRQLREISELNSTHIIMLTARSEEYSEVAGFEVGADDYIIKPIKPRALISRISAALNRKKELHEEADTIQIRDLLIDKSSYSITVGEHQITLPKKEFELLYFLAKNPNRVYDRKILLERIWGTDVYVLARTVDVHIRKVREKIGDGYISTVKGVGYKFISTNN